MIPEFQAYVGPQPFEEKDKDIFFGRDREARDLRSLVIAHRLVLVYAQSGAGKTSLINAGLIPLLKEKLFEVFPVARVKGAPKDIKTEEISNIFVFNTLTSLAKGDYDVERLAKMNLVDFLNSQEHMLDEYGIPLRHAVILDQFEEIFSLYQDRWKDREEFFEQVNTALEADPLLRVIFVIREDFIAQLDPYADLLPERLRARFHIERLHREAALLAIKEPLRDTGRSFTEGVAEKLVDDLLTIRVETTPGKPTEVSGEFIEAVQLQVVCQNLWQELPKDVSEITFDHLKTYGNVKQELSRFYEEAIRTTAEKAGISEERLRTLFEEVLITTMGTRGMVYRAQESTGGIPNVAIDMLESMHLIRAEWRAGARWYELTHDRFIEPILSSNKVFNDELAEKKRVEKEKTENERIEKEWAEKEKVERERAQKERAEKERVEKELRLQRELAESRRRINIGLAAFAIIFLFLAGFASYQWYQAEQYRQNATTQALNAQNQARITEETKLIAKEKNNESIASGLNFQSKGLQQDNNTLDTSILLAIESFRIKETSDAKQLIRHGLELIPHSVVVLKHNSTVNNVIFTPDGKYVSTASNDNKIYLWDVYTGQQVTKPIDLDSPIDSVVFSPDGKCVATKSDNKNIYLWNLSTEKKIPLNHDNRVTKVVFSPDGKYIATASVDNMVRVWNVYTGQQVTKTIDHASPINSVVFSPDGKYVATASDDRIARVRTVSGAEIRLDHNGSVKMIVFSPDGKYVATASSDRTARVWDVSTGNMNTGKMKLLQHKSPVNTVAFSPDEKYVVTDSDDETLRIWYTTTNPIKLKHYGPVNIVFSRDGKYIAITNADNAEKRAILLNVLEKKAHNLTHDGLVKSIAFSPDGKYIATASDDKTARIWDTTTYKMIFVLNHDGPVNSVVFSTDGKYVATASDDGTACLWDVATASSDNSERSGNNSIDIENLINETSKRLTRNLTPEEWKEYFGDEPYHKTFPNLL
jgi:WD40 repeat protein